MGEGETGGQGQSGQKKLKVNESEKREETPPWTGVMAEGLGEVHHGEYVTMPRHQKLNFLGQPILEDGEPVWCNSTTGIVSVQKPLIGKPHVTVVCVTAKNSIGQCHTTLKYKIK